MLPFVSPPVPQPKYDYQPEKNYPSPLYYAREPGAVTLTGWVQRKHPFDIDVEVDAVLYGQFSHKTLDIDAHRELPLDVGDDVVIVIPEDRQKMLIMTVIAGQSAERGVLAVYDEIFFMSDEGPSGMLTMKQFESFMATGQLQQDFNVVLAFPDGRGGREQSPPNFELHSDLGRFYVRSTPGACAVDHPTKPTWNNRGEVVLWVDFSGECSDVPPAGPHKRMVRFEGKAVGVDANDDIMLELVPWWPHLHRDDYERLVADRSIEVASIFVELEVDGSDRWVWHYNQERRDHRLVDADGIERLGAEFEREEKVLDTGDRLSHIWYQFLPDEIWMGAIVIEPPNSPPMEFLERVEAGQVKCYLSDGELQQACKLGEVGVLFRAISD